MEIKINSIKKFVEETCDLVKKTNNEFAIDEDQIKEIIEEEENFETDENDAFNILVDIFGRLDSDDLELYSDEIKTDFLDELTEMTDAMDEDELENLDECIEIDMTEEKPKKETKKDKKTSKKEAKDKKDSSEENEDEEDNTKEANDDSLPEDAVSFFENVKECVENDDILIDKDFVSEELTKTNIVDTINSIIEEMEYEDIDELDDENQAFYKKYKKGYSLKEEKTEKEEKKKTEKPKKDKAEKPKKETTKNDKKDAKKKEGESKDGELKDKKEDNSPDIEIKEKVNHKCSCSGEKTLILKGDASIIEALTKMLEVISK